MTLSIGNFRQLLEYDKFDLVKVHPAFFSTPKLWVYNRVRKSTPKSRSIAKSIITASDANALSPEIIESYMNEKDVGEVRYEFKNEFVMNSSQFIQGKFPQADFCLAETSGIVLTPPEGTILSFQIIADYELESRLKHLLKRFGDHGRYYSAIDTLSGGRPVAEFFIGKNTDQRTVNLFKLMTKHEDISKVTMYLPYVSGSNLNNSKDVWIKGIDDMSAVFKDYKNFILPFKA